VTAATGLDELIPPNGRLSAEDQAGQVDLVLVGGWEYALG
jgi:hypothetical protein